VRVLLDIEDGGADENENENENENEPPARWLYALASLDAYAQQLCPDHAERERMLDAVARDFLDEHAPGAARSQALVALGARFRELRKEVESLRHASGPLAHWQAHLQTSAVRRATFIAALRAHLEPLGDARLESVIHSLLHMHCNRLAPSEPRRHEVVLYDFARRLERARQAQRRAAGVPA